MIEIMTEMVQNDCGQVVNIKCKIGSRAQHWKPWKFFQYSIIYIGKDGDLFTIQRKGKTENCS